MSPLKVRSLSIDGACQHAWHKRTSLRSKATGSDAKKRRASARQASPSSPTGGNICRLTLHLSMPESSTSLCQIREPMHIWLVHESQWFQVTLRMSLLRFVQHDSVWHACPSQTLVCCLTNLSRFFVILLNKCAIVQSFKVMCVCLCQSGFSVLARPSVFVCHRDMEHGQGSDASSYAKFWA